MKPSNFFYNILLQILTDAALLKRQKLEIEELRNKLQVIVLVYIALTSYRMFEDQQNMNTSCLGISC